ncbi:MAG TPA: hypothetical protein PK256_16035, partial [Verrucomicrobiota bacterium]|nr:hypothetical protein [Verrucomicrobiota bacterium]
MKNRQWLFGLLGFQMVTLAFSQSAPGFYIPENPNYTLVNSVEDSLRFTLDKTLETDARGHLVSRSSFVDPEGA